MSWVAVGVAGFQVVSSLQQADTMRSQAALSRKVAGLNAEKAMIDSFNAEKDGYTLEARYQQTIDMVRSSQDVAYAAKGVDTGFGSAADTIGDTQRTAFLNKMDIRNQAHAKAMGYNNQASQILLQGDLNQSSANIQASSVEVAGQINAASTLLSGYQKFGTGGGNTTTTSGTPISPVNSGRYGANYVTNDI